MKIAQVTNFYRSGFGGEVTVFEFLIGLLEGRGHEVITYTRDSSTIGTTRDKARTFVTSIYSFDERDRMLAFLDRERPDVVHVHNLYPLLSPSVLSACRDRAVPVVMHLHNYALTCPIGLHFVRGRQCVKCLGGREHWGILRNCAGGVAKSVNYACRMAVARRLGLFRKNVDVFIAISEFARTRHFSAGLAEDQVRVLRNAVPVVPERPSDGARSVIGFAGRLEEIKGVDVFLDVARAFPAERFEIAGDGPLLERARLDAPANVRCLGRLDRSGMAEFYARCRAVLFPTRVFEGPPMTVLEAMSHGVPVVASNIGGIPEAIHDGVDGFLCDVTDSAAWIAVIAGILGNPRAADEIGARARRTIDERFSAPVYYEQLMAIYDAAIEKRRQRAVAPSAVRPTGSTARPVRPNV
ncbi:glycosyltransferase [Rhodoplanes roseus]|nr:glycosyltransferase [Rhodoplanes roseus]